MPPHTYWRAWRKARLGGGTEGGMPLGVISVPVAPMAMPCVVWRGFDVVSKLSESMLTGVGWCVAVKAMAPHVCAGAALLACKWSSSQYDRAGLVTTGKSDGAATRGIALGRRA